MEYNGIQLSDEAEYVVPGVKIIDNAIDNSDELISIAKSVPEMWMDSAVGGHANVDKDIRRSRSFPFNVHFTNPPQFFLAAQKIFLYAQLYAEENHTTFSHMEPISMLEYESGDGFYRPHFDFGPESPRGFSALLYLNDVEEGGETYFNEFDLYLHPVKNRLALFPANLPYAHEARLPKNDNKYVLVTWFGLPLSPEVFGNYYR